MKPIIKYTFDITTLPHSDPVALSKAMRKRALKRASWVDNVVMQAIPTWKLFILRRYPDKFVQKLLMVNIEIVHKQLIANFGTQISIYLNGNLIGSRKFKI